MHSYIADVFSGNPDNATIDVNTAEAHIHPFDNRRNIRSRLWKHSDDYLRIPEMTLIVINISFRGTAKTADFEMTVFVHCLQQMPRSTD